MCLPIDDRALECWLHNQVRMLEAWRESLASQPDIDLAQVRRLEAHYQWLTGEIAQMEANRPSPRPVRPDALRGRRASH